MQTNRLTGIRQGMGITGALVGIAWMYQQWFGTPSNEIFIALVEVVLGLAFLVWAVEERQRQNKAFQVVFLIAGMLSIAAAGYILTR